ncbi:MAX dimerization protein MGA a isoform X4 [Hypomesus transpacificus]|uniref:MAX dimerization protein MGA a isoform X4 n=1 Tax=Hypomesus transpacificus TaxID=137520 RepID=UPI001F08613A|nr:MAX dimerization protein MGA a isoform X4 [Hypomesus transpacificus]
MFMAAKKKKKEKVMVFHDEGADALSPVPMASSPSDLLVALKSGQMSKGGQGILVAKEEDNMGKCSPRSAKMMKISATLPLSKSSVQSNQQLQNLPPDLNCKGIKVTLDNNNMWNDFFRCKTEMIVTKQGSRMFPYCRFRISGLEPFQKYALLMDIHPVDNKRYKWSGQDWHANGKAETHIQKRPFVHPVSPNSGHYWMQNPVSFYMLKLTNSMLDQEGNVVLHSSHRYLPRLHVVLADKATEDLQLDGPDVITITFPQTEFIAVTAYQNSRFSQLKVNYNPFAKGFREDGPNSLALKLKSCPANDSKKDEARSSNELNPVKKSLKSLLANNKPKNSKVANQGLQRTEAQVVTGISTDRNKASGSGNTKSTEPNSSKQHPLPKNFSELIRESHVKLRRCKTEKEVETCTLQVTNTLNSVPKVGVKDLAESEDVPNSAHLKGPSAKTVRKTGTQSSVMPAKVDQNFITTSPVLINPQFVTEQSADERAEKRQKASNSSPVDFDPQRTSSEGQTREKVKPHKRPPSMPLPALALYLKQLRSKSMPDKNKPVVPSELSPHLTTTSQSPSQLNLTAPPAVQDVKPSDPSTSTYGQAIYKNISGSTYSLNPCGLALNPGNPTYSKHSPTSKYSNVDTLALAESKNQEPDLLSPEPHPVLLSLDQSLQASELSTCTTLLPHLPVSPSFPETLMSSVPDPVLYAPNPARSQSSLESPTLVLPSALNYGPPVSESYISHLSSHSSTLSSLPTITTSKPLTAPLLQSPEHLSCDVESLSPRFLPHSEPSLPFSGTLESTPTLSIIPPTSSSETFGQRLDPEVPLRSTTKGSVQGLGPSAGVSLHESQMSIFSALPPPDPFLTSFTSFLPTPHSASLAMGSSSMFSMSRPSHSLSHPGSLDLGAASSFPSDPDAFQVNDQTLPFPPTLSPLALPLSLSPSFSSLGPDPLSPTPSLTDLVHFFSNNDDLNIDDDFPSNEPSPPIVCPPSIRTPSISVFAQAIPASKPRKRKGKIKKRKSAKTVDDSEMGVAADVNLQPNLEEVEEQLFVSFTSKEALEIHLGDTTQEVVPQKTFEPVGVTETLEERIATLEEVLLKDLKLMKHRQVIHPVLQEVGLKMSLLDTKLSIDLQYLGVHLPIPQYSNIPGQSSEAPSPSGSAVFVSRTGKTKDVTQIKGWREKFAPSESSESSSSSSFKPDVVPSSDGTTTKNLSAFCSDMLDEYLANEGKLIDERAASFSQTVVNPVTYELPTKSSSYVRTLDSVLKKQTQGPTSSIISDFIPPSKRPKLPPLGFRNQRRTKKEQMQDSKENKTKILTTLTTTTSAPKPPPKSAPKPVQTSGSIVSQSVQPEHTAPFTPNPKDTVQKKRKKKSKVSEGPTGSSADMAPLESDSELGPAANTIPNSSTVITKTMLKMKDLEDGVVWEGRHRTCITEERAEIALTSLFTLAGFVCENPTAPVRIIKCRAPPCLNVFCRLGCVCSSLIRKKQITHCAKTDCIFGCSCFRQKVVLLKNLEGPDSSASDDSSSRKRRKRRMRMAYTLKEAEMSAVSQPAHYVGTLWKPREGEIDPEPLHEPASLNLSSPSSLCNSKDEHMTCARVRAFQGRNKEEFNQPTQKDNVSQPQSIDSVSVNCSKTAALKPPLDPLPSTEPAKRLEVVSECRWKNRLDRNYVLRVVCERMVQDRLNIPFRVKGYLVRPLTQNLVVEGQDCTFAYKVHISQVAQLSSGIHAEEKDSQEGEAGMEDWQRELEDDFMEELEDEVEKEKMEVEWRKSELESKEENKKKSLKFQGLPFLIGISPAGILTANKKQPGGSEKDLVQVNGRSYPHAKIQLGKMGAIHPANRLAAYLTGRLSHASQEQVKVASSSTTNPTIASNSKPQKQPSAVGISAPQRTPSAATSSNTSVTTSDVQKTVVSVSNTAPGEVGAPKPTMLIIPVPGTNNVFKMPCPTSQPLTPITPGQRMLLQPICSTKGTTVYRNPEGKLIQLVPLSQLQALNPNLVVQKAVPLASAQPVLSTSVSSPASLPKKTFSCGQVLKPVPPGPSSTVTHTPPSVHTASKASPNVTVLSSSLPTLVPLTVKSPGSQVKVTETAVKKNVMTSTTTSSHPSTSSSDAILGEERVYSPTFISSKSTDSSKIPVTSINPPVPYQKVSLNQTPQTSSVTEPSSGMIGQDVVCRREENYKGPGKRVEDGGRMDISEARHSLGVEEEVDVVDLDSDSATDTDSEEDTEETEDSEVDTNACPLKVVDKKILHNVLERLRRGDLKQRFKQLREALELDEKSTKIHILNQAKREIKILQRSSKSLKKEQASLANRRAECFEMIDQLTAKSGDKEEQATGAVGTERQHVLEDSEKVPSLVNDVTEAVNLLDDTEEETDNSSDEHPFGQTDIINVTSDEGEQEWESVDSKTMQENVDALRTSDGPPQPNNDATCSTEENMKYEDKVGIAKLSRERYTTQYKNLTEMLDIKRRRSTGFVLNQACREIRDLSDKCKILERLKAAQTQTRTDYILKVSQLTGKKEERILWKVQEISTMQKEDQRRRVKENERRKAVLARKAVLQPPAQVSNRPKTVPNILSRRKKLLPIAMKPMEGVSPYIHTDLLPTGLLVIPGQQVITMAPLQPISSSLLHPVSLSGLGLHPSPTPGVASVTISIPSLSQHVKALPLSLNPPGNVDYRISLAAQHPQVLTQNIGQTQAPGAPGPASTAQSSALTVQGVGLHEENISSDDPDIPSELQSLPPPVSGTGGGPQKERGAMGEGDDERSLSPMFLNLDEDKTGSHGDNKSSSSLSQRPGQSLVPELDHHPGQQSNSRSGSVLDSDTLTPPPLLQMKVGGVAIVADTNVRAEEKQESEVAWRPMPRLAPLGLKTNPQS